MVQSCKLKSLYTMHGGVFQFERLCTPCIVYTESFNLKDPLHYAWGSLSHESPCTQCMVESLKWKSLYTMHGGVLQINSLYTMHGGVFQFERLLYAMHCVQETSI